MNLSNITDRIVSVSLNVYNLPLFKELRGSDNYITYGYNNLYPQYLVDMYNQSAVHNAIISGKVNYIVGRGLRLTGSNGLFANPNPFENIDKIFQKIASDYEVNNGYAYEVTKNKKSNKIESIYHIDFSRLRLSIDKKGYWYSTEWTYINAEGERCQKITPKKIYIPKYISGGKQERSVYVFNKYRPDFGDYPLPDYVGALSAIETSVEICNYHLNNIKNGFAAGTMINMYNGIPDDEKKNDIVRDIKAKATGSNKAGEVFVNFAVDKEHGAEVLPMQPTNLDKQFEQLSKSTQETIFIGHKITNGGLFGVKTEGQLGGTNKEELAFAYEQFKETYIIHRQADLLYGLKYLLSDFGGSDEVEIDELRPIMPDLQLSEATILKYVTDKALSVYIADKYGVETTDIPKEPTQTKLSKFEPIDYFKYTGKNYPNYIVLSSETATGENKEFQFVAGIDKIDEKILKTIEEFPTATPTQIAKIVGENKKDVIDRIDNLASKDLIKINKIGFDILPDGEDTIKKIGGREKLKVVYSYETRLDAPKLIGESRDFCKELTTLSESGKRWTKDEIEGLRNEMTVSFLPDIKDVWLFRGGWYREPGSDVSVPQCRHRWVQHIIIEKESQNFSFFNENQLRDENGMWTDESDIYNPNSNEYYPLDKDPIGTWDAHAINDEDRFKKMVNKLEEVGFEKGAIGTSISKTDYGESYYIFPDKLKDGGGDDIKIRISDHSVSNIDRMRNEYHAIRGKEGQAIKDVEYYFYSERFLKKKIKVNVTNRIEIPSHKLLNTDKIISERVSKSNNKIYNIERTYNNFQTVIVRKK